MAVQGCRIQSHFGCYSSVPNKRVGWNKHVGGKIMRKLINMLDGINVLVGIFGNIGGKIKGSYGTNKQFFKEIGKISNN